MYHRQNMTNYQLNGERKRVQRRKSSLTRRSQELLIVRSGLTLPNLHIVVSHVWFMGRLPVSHLEYLLK